jgi:hypothetical protein
LPTFGRRVVSFVAHTRRLVNKCTLVATLSAATNHFNSINYLGHRNL